MVDISKLLPHEVAMHFGNPTGDVGVAVGEFMNRNGENVTREVYQRLALKPGQSVIEIGIGNGQFVETILGLAPGLTFTGVDISETMIQEATSRNRSFADRATFRCASVDALPFGDRQFDAAASINCIYFWGDPVKCLKELRRVLKSSAPLIVAAVAPETAAASPIFKTEYGFTVYDRDALARLATEAGFRDVNVEYHVELGLRYDGTQIERRFSLLRAAG
jgi:ubiquinone/menaquinone biosynthesis C-methylase UbiE